MEKLLNIIKKLYYFASPELIYNYGVDAYKFHLYKLAKFYFELAIEKEPKKVNAIFNLALTCNKLAENSNSIDYLKKCISLDKNDVDFYVNLSIFLRNLNRQKDALKILNSYEKIDSSIIMQKAVCLLELKEFEELIELVKLIFKQKLIKNPDAIVLQIAVYAYEMNISLTDFTYINCAFSLLKILIGLKFKNFEIYYLYSNCYAKMANWKLAANYCVMALDYNENSQRALSLMGMILYCNSNYEKALEYYLKAEKRKFINDTGLLSDISHTYEILKNRPMMKLYLIKMLFLHPFKSDKKYIFERLFKK